jgi:hypothetical protein
VVVGAKNSQLREKPLICEYGRRAGERGGGLGKAEEGWGKRRRVGEGEKL